MRRYAIEPPPAAGATTTLGFDLELPTHGFTNEESNSDVVYNGTFINGRARLPLIGYQESVELERDQDRKKFGLAAKHFHYRMDAPILDFFAFQSARDAVKTQTWHGSRSDVAIGIYHQPGHKFDLDSMDDSVKDALACCSAAFGL